MAQPTPDTPTARRPAVAIGLATLAMALGAALPGCQSVGSGSLLSGLTPRHDESMADGMVRPENASTGRMLSRYLTPMKTPHASAGKEPKSLSLGNEGWEPVKIADNPEADAELEKARRLDRQDKTAESEPLLAQIAKKRKGTPWGEKAQWLLAESYYRRGKYVWANDAYEQLFKDYSGTEYAEKLVARQFEIAQKWLAFADPKAKPELKLPWTAAFEGKVPLVDPGGHAIKTLEHVRDHDVKGPLSDDAVLKMADHYYNARDFESASLYYDELVNIHRKSEHVRRAQLLSIDSKLKGYMGPEYDGQGLDAAKDMVTQTRTTFPDHREDDDKLYHTLDLINDQHAERAYTRAMYYKRKGFVPSAEYYFSLVNARWPKTEWAKKSKVELAALAKLPRKESVPSKMMSQPVNSDPFSGGTGSGGSGGGMGGGMGGMGGGMGNMGIPG